MPVGEFVKVDHHLLLHKMASSTDGLLSQGNSRNAGRDNETAGNKAKSIHGPILSKRLWIVDRLAN